MPRSWWRGLGLCLVAGFAVLVGLLVLNALRLVQAESLASDFVRDALAEGSGLRLPPLARGAQDRFWRDETRAMLDRARQIGPVEAIDTLSCGVQTDPLNLCGGQLFACVVDGRGRKGAFQAAVALCRANDLTSYELAGVRWRFGETEPGADESLGRDEI